MERLLHKPYSLICALVNNWIKMAETAAHRSLEAKSY
jgi:hypothetical protein